MEAMDHTEIIDTLDACRDRVAGIAYLLGSIDGDEGQRLALGLLAAEARRTAEEIDLVYDALDRSTE